MCDRNNMLSLESLVCCKFILILSII